jgi:uncharacterized protein (UPF0276 family)
MATPAFKSAMGDGSDIWGGPPKLGLAYSAGVPAFVHKHSATIDYLEVPYELLRHNPAVIRDVGELKPLVLHCASLSIAGSVRATSDTLDQVVHWIEVTRTPWLGEHLSFISADRPAAGLFDAYAPGEPYNIGYTVSPPMNEDTVTEVCRAVEFYQQRIHVPMLLENPPIYFRIPGSTIGQVEFIRKVCAESAAHLLLDLTHFYITSRTVGFDPLFEVLSLPLERIVELHISGVDFQDGVHWDHHASRAPDAVLELLAIVLPRTDARAITLEYNWVTLPEEVLVDEIRRVRNVVASVPLR